MFTGLVEEIGILEQVIHGRESRRFRVTCALTAEGLRADDSVSVEGVCLTVTEVMPGGFEATAVATTLKTTTLDRKKAGDPVNLERALVFGNRLGGHLVQGHVDGIGTVASVRVHGDSRMLTVQLPSDTMRYMVLRGSVALNGVSLTVADMSRDRISVSVIPHTYEKTTLKRLSAGSRVNVEVDLFAKYAEHFCSRPAGASGALDRLAQIPLEDV